MLINKKENIEYNKKLRIKKMKNLRIKMKILIN
jgi:hypothetical protein